MTLLWDGDFNDIEILIALWARPPSPHAIVPRHNILISRVGDPSISIIIVTWCVYVGEHTNITTLFACEVCLIAHLHLSGSRKLVLSDTCIPPRYLTLPINMAKKGAKKAAAAAPAPKAMKAMKAKKA